MVLETDTLNKDFVGTICTKNVAEICKHFDLGVGVFAHVLVQFFPVPHILVIVACCYRRGRRSEVYDIWCRSVCYDIWCRSVC